MLSPNILWKFLHAGLHYVCRRCLCIRDKPCLRCHAKHFQWNMLEAWPHSLLTPTRVKLVVLSHDLVTFAQENCTWNPLNKRRTNLWACLGVSVMWNALWPYRESNWVFFCCCEENSLVMISIGLTGFGSTESCKAVHVYRHTDWQIFKPSLRAAPTAISQLTQTSYRDSKIQIGDLHQFAFR